MTAIGSLTGSEQRFVERMGLVLNFGGRTPGRLTGLLLLAERPLSLEELATLLRVSKASISTNARFLEQVGLIERTSLPGDRRDFYLMAPSFIERVAAAKLGTLESMIPLMEEGLDAVGDGNTVARERLNTVRNFYLFLAGEIANIMTRWERHKQGSPDPGNEDSVR